MKSQKIELGAKVEDVITRFSGTVISRHEYLHETTCYRVVSPQLSLEGKEQSEFLPEGRLRVIG